MQNQWSMWQTAAPTPAPTMSTIPQPPSGFSVGTDPTVMMNTYMQYYNQPAPSGYTAEQWASAQQQNWTQWQQWQQQYQQWQNQYGDKYQETMKQFQTPNLSFQPSLPPMPPPPKEDGFKPPLPPENVDQYKYPLPPPHQNNLPLFPSKGVGEPAGNNQTSQGPTRAETQQPTETRNPGDKSAPSQSLCSENVKKIKLDDDKLNENERNFDAQFKQWEEQFNTWKQKNANHPDKEQYKQYEAKWTIWREKLVERREQMRRKREQQRQAMANENKSSELAGGDKIMNMLSNTDNMGLINNVLGIGQKLGLTGKQEPTPSNKPPPPLPPIAAVSLQPPPPSSAPVSEFSAMPPPPMTLEMSRTSLAAQQWAHYNNTSYGGFPAAPPAAAAAPTITPQLPTEFLQPPPSMPGFSQPPPNFQTSSAKSGFGMSSKPPPLMSGFDINKKPVFDSSQSNRNTFQSPDCSTMGRGNQRNSQDDTSRLFGNAKSFGSNDDNYDDCRDDNYGSKNPKDMGGGGMTGPMNDMNCFGLGKERCFDSNNDRFGPGNNRFESGNERFGSSAGGNEGFGPGRNDRFGPGNDRFGPRNNQFGSGNDRFEPGNNNDQVGSGNDRFGPGNDRFGCGSDRSGGGSGNDRFGPGNNRFASGNDSRFGSDNDRFGSSVNDRFGSSSGGDGGGGRFGSGNDRFGSDNDGFGNNRFGANQGNNSSGRFGPNNDRRSGPSFEPKDEMSPELRKLMEKRKAALDAFKPSSSSSSFLSGDKAFSPGLSESFKKISGESPFLSKMSLDRSTKDSTSNPQGFDNTGSPVAAPAGGMMFAHRPPFAPRGPDFGTRGPGFGPRGPNFGSPRGGGPFMGGPIPLMGPGGVGSPFMSQRPPPFGAGGPPRAFGINSSEPFKPVEPFKSAELDAEKKTTTAATAQEDSKKPEYTLGDKNAALSSTTKTLSQQSEAARATKSPTEQFTKDSHAGQSCDGPGMEKIKDTSQVLPPVAAAVSKDKLQEDQVTRKEVEVIEVMDDSPKHNESLQAQDKYVPGEVIKKSNDLPFMGENDPKPSDLNMEPPPEFPDMGPMKSTPETPSSNAMFGNTQKCPFGIGPRAPFMADVDSRIFPPMNLPPRNLNEAPPRNMSMDCSGDVDERNRFTGNQGPNFDSPMGPRSMGPPNFGPNTCRSGNSMLNPSYMSTPSRPQFRPPMMDNSCSNFSPRGMNNSFGPRNLNAPNFSPRGMGNPNFGPPCRPFNDGPNNSNNQPGFGPRGPFDNEGINNPGFGPRGPFHQSPGFRPQNNLNLSTTFADSAKPNQPPYVQDSFIPTTPNKRMMMEGGDDGFGAQRDQGQMRSNVEARSADQGRKLDDNKDQKKLSSTVGTSEKSVAEQSVVDNQEKKEPRSAVCTEENMDFGSMRKDGKNQGVVIDEPEKDIAHRRPKIVEYQAKQQFNYNHCGLGGERRTFPMAEHAPVKVVDYGHKPRRVTDYLVPSQSFDYGHGKLNPSVTEHQMEPKPDFRFWEDNEQNLREYEKLMMYENTLKARERAMYQDLKMKEQHKMMMHEDYLMRRERERERWIQRNLESRDYRKRNRQVEHHQGRDNNAKVNRDNNKSEEKKRDKCDGGGSLPDDFLEDISLDGDSDRELEDFTSDSENKKSTFDNEGIPEAPPPPLAAAFDIANLSNVTMVDDILSPPGRQNRPPKIAIILRGPPGSGKSFVAKIIKDKEVEQGGSAPRILSIDDYFLVEGEVESTDDKGKKIVSKEMVYEYEEAMEPSYITSLVKAFKKNITDGFFNFIILDAINEKITDYEDMWSFAKSKGFKVYICEMEMDVQICLKRNIHNRTEEEVNRIIDYFEPTPTHHQKIDVNSVLQDETIEEVQMEDSAQDQEETVEQSESKEVDSQEDSQDAADSVGVSKWELMDAENKLDRLDGLAKPKKKAETMEEFLQVPECYDVEDDGSGKKRVRWADLEEQKEQEKMRRIGFVVGHTDWERMMDPTKGSGALTRTKYI